MCRELDKLEERVKKIIQYETDDIARTEKEGLTYANMFYRGRQSAWQNVLDLIKLIRAESGE